MYFEPGDRVIYIEDGEYGTVIDVDEDGDVNIVWDDVPGKTRNRNSCDPPQTLMYVLHQDII